MSLILDLQIALDWPTLPTEARFRSWAEATLPPSAEPIELTVRVVDEAEMTLLNSTYRHKSGPTNVLSFPFEAPLPELDIGLLGDVVLCAPVIEREAALAHKNPEAHWAHLVIHGVLHLQGHDHQEAAAAAVMEQLETRILATLGYPDPYGDAT